MKVCFLDVIVPSFEEIFGEILDERLFVFIAFFVLELCFAALIVTCFVVRKDKRGNASAKGKEINSLTADTTEGTIEKEGTEEC